MANPLTSRLLDQKFKSEMKKRKWKLFIDDSTEISFFNTKSSVDNIQESAGYKHRKGYYWEMLVDNNEPGIDPDDYNDENMEIDTQYFGTMQELLDFLDNK